MTQSILRVIALSLVVATAVLILTQLINAQGPRNQDGGTTTVHALRQEKTLEQVGKNIQVLNGMPQSQLYPAMRFMAASLGFQCGSCHVIKSGRGDFPADDKPEKQTARKMIRMVAEINKTLGQGNPTVSCYTYHRGQRSPQGAPILPLLLPAPRPPIGEI